MKAEYFSNRSNNLLNAEKSERILPFSVSFTCGATAGAVAGIITLPFDVIKTHRQIEMVESNEAPSSTMRLLLKLYRTNGFQSLFTGAVPRLVKIVPACAIMISSFEAGKTFFENVNHQRYLDNQILEILSDEDIY